MGELDDLVPEFLVESNENLDRLDEEFVALEKNPAERGRLASIFRTIHTIKGTCGFLGFSKLEAIAHAGESLLSKLRDGAIALDAEITTALLALVDAVRAILGRIEQTGAEGDESYPALQATLAALNASRSGAKPVAPAAPVVAAESVESAKPAASEGSLRVDVGLIDELMNLVGELVLARNQILQLTAVHGDAALAATMQRLNLITSELQEGVMKTRMQPIGNVWSKFPRVVRDVSVQCGKQVRLEMEGKETELDRTIIEAIKDPLTHLVRNALDHGLEPGAARVAAGKPAEGCITLRAYQESGQVIVEIADDGAGIDPQRVKRKAVEKGVLAADQAAAMSPRDAVNLIFLPGFTTAEKVTNLSGRGVGMDVVRANVEKIGGTVDVTSEVGRGTTIRIKIPPTLAIIPALIVVGGDGCFAIPQVNLEKLIRIDAEQMAGAIESIHGTPVHRLRGNLLPLVDLGRLLAGEATTIDDLAVHRRDCVNLVVLQAEERQFGLVIDRIHDTQEIVVKPLCKLLKSLELYAGVTIMGDGRVALILDVGGVARAAGIVAKPHEKGRAEKPGAVDAARPVEAGTFLVFRAGGRRMAVPLADAVRLEEFRREQIELSAGHPVAQYRGEIIPLVHAAGGSSWLAEGGDVRAVIGANQGAHFGLVIDDVPDIVCETIRVRQPSAEAGGGESVVLQGKVTELLGLRRAVERIDPRALDVAVAAGA